MEYCTKYRRPKLEEEIFDPVSRTETAGYIRAEDQITAFIDAGRRLDEYRREMYDFGDGEEVPDDFIDPTRSGSFDLADASILGSSVATSIRRQASEERRRKTEAVTSDRTPPVEENKKE